MYSQNLLADDVVAAFPEDLVPSAAGLGILALPLALLVDVVVGPLVHLAVAGRPVPRLGAHLARVRRIATSCLVGLLFRNGVDGRLSGEGEAGLASHPGPSQQCRGVEWTRKQLTRQVWFERLAQNGNKVKTKRLAHQVTKGNETWFATLALV